MRKKLETLADKHHLQISRLNKLRTRTEHWMLWEYGVCTSDSRRMDTMHQTSLCEHVCTIGRRNVTEKAFSGIPHLSTFSPGVWLSTYAPIFPYMYAQWLALWESTSRCGSLRASGVSFMRRRRQNKRGCSWTGPSSAGHPARLPCSLLVSILQSEFYVSLLLWVFY